MGKQFLIDTQSPPDIGPINQTRYVWCCDNGCGTCEALLVEFRTMHHTVDGHTTQERTGPKLVSSCCGVSMFLWDNVKDDEVLTAEAMEILR